MGRFNEAEARAPRIPFDKDGSLVAHGRGFNEAEARAPRIQPPPPPPAKAPIPASMRPRHARLGYVRKQLLELRQRFGASMRPRHARLGYSSSAALICGMLDCFNEAEARAPRILGFTAIRVLTAAIRFNEAEARAPRIRP